MNDNIIISNILIQSQNIIISYKGSLKIDAWLEDYNKHYPNILSLLVDYQQKQISISKNKLISFAKDLPGHKFKLSLCSTNRRIVYQVLVSFKKQGFENISVSVIDNCILFCTENVISYSSIEYKDNQNLLHRNVNHFENIQELPVNLLDIGSCFSRSIFKTDDYFNPTYKQYFCVKNTLFHNSFISLFSNPFKYDYSKIYDLTTGDAGKYIGIEFSKDVKNLFKENNYQLIVIDNYIDAVCPIIKIKENTYITYNKYFSESIFKRFFSSCEIIYPGTKQHLSLYKKSISLFHDLLNEYNIRNVVLIGGRLSRYKIDKETLTTTLWNDKMDWILSTNHIWNEVDKIFLREIPFTNYIDKTKTNWMSDNQSPIIGGASPSHYQSEYYKEIFNNLLQLISGD